MKAALLKATIRAGSAVARWLRGRRDPPAPGSVRRIVMLQMSGIGDLLLTTPALRALHGLYPAAQIEVVTYRPSNGAFLRGFPYVGRIEAFALFDLRLTRIWRREFWEQVGRPIRFLRCTPCDLYVSFHHTWMLQWYLLELWVAFRSGARFQIGINPDCVNGPGVFDRALPESQLGDRHYRPFFLELVGLLGEAGKDLATEFPLASAQIEAARRMLGEGLSGRRAVCLHVGATHAAQLWPLDRFVELARRLVQEHRGIVLIGTSEERSLTDRLAAALPSGSVLNLAGRTTLGEMAAVIAASDLFIGNDSGPLHVAIACRRPAIGLIGPGRPRYHRYAPEEATMLVNPIAFDIRDEKHAPYPWAIGVDEVHAAATRLLA